MLINPNKKYSKLITVGCSYTNGYFEQKSAQWGEFLSTYLKCPHELFGVNASSNYFIQTSIINYCENQKNLDFCVGIQWSELSRREIWKESHQSYLAFNLPTLMLGNKEYEFNFMKEHMDFFSNVFFNETEMVWRTMLSMISVTSYLRERNIDFIMFEGINSIKDFSNQNPDLPVSDEIKERILNQPEIFKKYGDMHNHMRTHELFNQNNGGHPNSEYIQWWVSEMYDYMLEYYDLK